MVVRHFFGGGRADVGLTGRTLLLVAGILTVACPILACLLWSRLRGPFVVRVAQRLMLFGGGQALAVFLVLLLVNNSYNFYTSWTDLLGSAPPAPVIAAGQGRTTVGPQGAVTTAGRSVQRTSNGGELVTALVYGGRSGVTGQVLVLLPPGYEGESRRYPVLELLAGWRGGPQSWIHALHVLDPLQRAMSQGQLPPTIVVLPASNIAMPRDVECTDVPHGPQAETWLTTDIRDLVLSQYRARSDAGSWAVMGFSTGGYCAAKFALHFPHEYGAAVVISGYFNALRDATTQDLWGGSPARRNENSPLWLVTHRPPSPVTILAFASRQDAESYPTTLQFQRAARPPLRVTSAFVSRGGHNLRAIIRALPEMFVWVGHFFALRSPVAPGAVRLVLGGGQAVQLVDRDSGTGEMLVGEGFEGGGPWPGPPGVDGGHLPPAEVASSSSCVVEVVQRAGAASACPRRQPRLDAAARPERLDAFLTVLFRP